MIRLLSTIFWTYEIIVIIRVVFSWVRVSRYSPGWAGLRDFTYALTEPLLRPIRRRLAPYQKQMSFDFSPLVLLVILWIVEGIIIHILRGPFQ